MPRPVRNHREDCSNVWTVVWTGRPCVCLSMLWAPHDAQCHCRHGGCWCCCFDPVMFSEHVSCSAEQGSYSVTVVLLAQFNRDWFPLECASFLPPALSREKKHG